MTITLNDSQLLLNLRLIANYESTHLASDEKGTLHRHFKWGSKAIFSKDISNIDIKSGIPHSHSRSEQIRPAVLATLFGVLHKFDKSEGRRYFTIPTMVPFENVPVLEECSFISVAKKIQADPCFNDDEVVLAAASKVIQVVDNLPRHHAAIQ